MDLPDEIVSAAGRVHQRNASALLSCSRLGEMAKAFDLGWFADEHIHALWKAAIVRADLIVSSTPIDLPGLTLIPGPADQFQYTDNRRVSRREQGHGSSPEAQGGLDVELFFNPFRAFVLYHVDRTLTVSTPSTQYLLYKEGVAQRASHAVDHLDQWTSSDSFGDRFRDWNVIAEVSGLFDVLWKSRSSDEARGDERDYAIVVEWIRVVGEMVVRQWRGELGRSAEDIDPNRQLHVLIRLLSQFERDKIKGRVGASMQCLNAAEAIRRVAEEALGKLLPEEDEIGLGTWFKGARQSLYGTTRVFDAPRSVLRDYLTSLGIDYGIKARCYGEGPTEYGAISAAFPDSSGIELVDLKGGVLERKGKVVQFADSLRRDHQAGVFSIVLLDGDKHDAVRALKAAVASGDCFVVHFIAEPDFEFANFTVNELLSIALDIECRAEVDGARRSRLMTELSPHLQAVRGASDFFDVLRRFDVRQVTKGLTWGKELMAYAQSRPSFPAQHPKGGQQRPLVTAAKMVERALRSGFARSIQRSAIDPMTGQPVPRKQEAGPE